MPSGRQSGLPLEALCDWELLNHTLVRINIETNVIKLVRQLFLYLFYHVLLIIRKFIPKKASKSIIAATQVMMIMHGA